MKKTIVGVTVHLLVLASFLAAGTIQAEPGAPSTGTITPPSPTLRPPPPAPAPASTMPVMEALPSGPGAAVASPGTPTQPGGPGPQSDSLPNFQDLFKNNNNAESAKRLANLIESVQDSDLSDHAKKTRIAIIVSRALMALDTRSRRAAVFLELADRLSNTALAVVTAATTIAAGADSKYIIDLIIGAWVSGHGDLRRIQIVESSAKKPRSVLGADTIALIRSVIGIPVSTPSTGKSLGSRPGTETIISVNPSAVAPIGQKYSGQ